MSVLLLTFIKRKPPFFGKNEKKFKKLEKTRIFLFSLIKNHYRDFIVSLISLFKRMSKKLFDPYPIIPSPKKI